MSTRVMRVFLFVVFTEPKGSERHFIQVKDLNVPSGEERAFYSDVWDVAFYASFRNVRCPEVQTPHDGQTYVFPGRTGAFDFRKDGFHFVVLVMFEEGLPEPERLVGVPLQHIGGSRWGR